MLLDEMCSRLMVAAEAMNWESRIEPALTARSFRGRVDEADVCLPDQARGLILGCYPVLAAGIRLAPHDALMSDLRAAHNQMIIARSFMRSAQVIDSHILFVANEPPSETDWKQQMDLIERNETVCRKLVWMPLSTDLDSSFQLFRDRTFLAQPWLGASQHSDAPLDQNELLVETVLQEQGLRAETALAWVKLAKSGLADADELVEQLVSAMELPT